MIYSLADAVMLMSIARPLTVVVVVGMWAWIVSNCDKDLNYFFLHRRIWNAVQIAAGILAFFLWLLLPYFWVVGLPLTLLIIGSAIGGYIYYRNSRVSKAEKWRCSLESFRRFIGEMQSRQAQTKATVTLLSADNAPLEVPSGDTPQAKAHELFQDMVDYAIPRGADLIEVAIDAKRTRVSVRIDGVRFSQPDMETPLALALMDYLKGAADFDLTEHRRKQDGFVKFDTQHYGRHEFGVTTLGSTQGRSMILSVDPRKQASIPFEELGLLDSQREHLAKVLDDVGKIVIISSPSNHGQTSTLYSFLQRHDPYTQSVWTYEDDIPFEIEGVSHERIPVDASAETINKHLTTMFRRDPQVIYFGRVPDELTAKTVINGEPEVRIYLGMRKSDTLSALRQWVSVAGDVGRASRHLGAIVSQRLVRKLCPTCRTPYTPDAAAMKKLNLPAKRVTRLYKASGQVLVNRKPQECETCHGRGYSGRTGAFEVIILDDEARRMIKTKQIDKLRSYLRKQKTLWLQEAALAKVLDGTTDIKEITRAFSAGAERASSRTAAGRAAIAKTASKGPPEKNETRRSPEPPGTHSGGRTAAGTAY